MADALAKVRPFSTRRSAAATSARNATLSIMVGGNAKAFAAVMPLLQLMGKTITHCGPSGSGQLTKLVNQVLVTLTNLAVCEALTLAGHGGLDPSRPSWPSPAERRDRGSFPTLAPRWLPAICAWFHDPLAVKDLRLVQEAAKQAGLNLRRNHAGAAVFRRSAKTGRWEIGDAVACSRLSNG